MSMKRTSLKNLAASLTFKGTSSQYACHSECSEQNEAAGALKGVYVDHVISSTRRSVVARRRRSAMVAPLHVKCAKAFSEQSRRIPGEQKRDIIRVGQRLTGGNPTSMRR